MRLKNVRCEKCKRETGMVKNDITGQIWCMMCGHRVENIAHVGDAVSTAAADRLGGNK